MLLPFPQDLPIEGVGIIIDRLRGKPIPLQTVINAAWNLAGYAMTQIPIQQQESHDAPVQDFPITDNEIISLFEKIQGTYQTNVDGKTVEFGVISWAIVLKVLIKIIVNAAL